jgi:hypothetical protein
MKRDDTKTRTKEEPEILNNAPLERVPQQEIEVIFLFSQIFQNYGFTKIKKIQSNGFPDCIAYRKTNSGRKEVSIEFEYKSINYKNHLPKLCDCLVCWEDNWYDKPEKIEVIELRTFYGYTPKIWVLSVNNDYKQELSGANEHDWTVPAKSRAGDLILFYYNAPDSCIKEIFQIKGQYLKAEAGNWTKRKTDVFAHIERIAPIKSPIFYEDLKRDRSLSQSRMVLIRMTGRSDVTPYWHNLYNLIIAKNPGLKKDLENFSPTKIFK